MTPPRPIARPTAASLPPGRAFRAFKKQLDSPQSLNGRRYDEAADEERQWNDFSERIFEMAFGKPSTAMDDYYCARSAGTYQMLMQGESAPHHEDRRNFEMRIAALESFINASL